MKRMLAGKVGARGSVGKTTRVALAVLVLASLAFGFALVDGWGRSDATLAEVELINGTQRVLSTTADLESSERGYVLTGEPAFLDPYRAGVQGIEGQFSQLGLIWPSTGAGADALARLRALTDSQIEFASTVIQVRTADGFQAAANLVRSGQGKARMDALRSEIAIIQQGAQERVASIGIARTRTGFIATLAFVGAMLAALALAANALKRQFEARRAADLLNGVLANAPVGIGFLDRDLTVTRINDPGNAAAGQESVTNGFANVFPNETAKIRSMLDQTLTTGKVFSNIELMRTTDDGEHTYLASFYPLYAQNEAEGKPDGVGFMFVDTTERNRAELRMRDSEARFRTLADHIPQMAWIAQPSGKIYWYNQRWYDFTGASREDVEGFGWQTIHHPDYVERVSANFRSRIAEGLDWEDTFPLRAADGSYRWFLSRAVPIHNAAGEIERWFGTNTDVTRQRAVEQELSAARDAAEEANRAKSQFIANMSHELRTPLTAVIGYAEMLEEEVEESGANELLPDLRKINQNARHLLNLINNVLDLSKIEAERMDLHIEAFSVSKVAEEVASAVQSLMEKKDNTLVVELGPELGEMNSDDTKLRQCLLNLLSNASKFTEAGKVTLRVDRIARMDGDRIVFAVTDSGIGMSEEQLESLFERFTQADSSTTRKFGGTGLGLAITRAFCRLLGGDIAVTSEEGKGSTFTIDIPATASEQADDDVHNHPIAPEARAASSGLVLAIDDDPHARELVERFLTREGFIVRTAADGVAGLQTARDVRPDVILLDITMPRMDGWSVLAALKDDADLSHIPVVMLSVIDEHSLGYARGAADYLTKPVEWDQLREVMDRFRASENTLVLVVDDDPHIRDLMTTMLEREGLSVTTAANGRLALELLKEMRPGLILLDLVMPEMDGFAFLRALRQRDYLAGIPVVVLTSKDLTREEYRRLREGSDKVVSKGGVELRELAEEIRVVIQNGGVSPARQNIVRQDEELSV